MEEMSFYLSEEGNLNKASEMTELGIDEIEDIVGRFAAHSKRAGKLRGQVIEYPDGSVIRDGFTKKVLWRSE